ncbi:MAG: OmpA family protein [Phycisphaeraceae bacterium]|nr:OmpA family protein [Phycisphaeraceae bacterium]
MSRHWTRRSLGALATLALGALVLGGCAKSRDDMLTTTNSLQDQNERLRSELADARRMLAERDGASSEARGLLAEYQAEIQRLEGEIDRRDRALRDMEGRINSMDVAQLDPATDYALAQLASQYPNLLTYDSDKGMLRFNSDLTFDSGSAEVKESAQQTLSRLAQILNASAAQTYVIDIVGHTDNQRISAATAARHPTNLHLSCHRAIAVDNALAGLGVARERMRASGWGEFRPLVPNNANAGTAANRRVEVYLTRSRWDGVQSAGVSEGGIEIDRAAPPARQIDPTK